jgi:hypothetical protein
VAETEYSVRIVKKFTYRGDPVKEWSNRYFFNGGAPADQAAWYTLMDAIVLIEKACYTSQCQIIAAHGYAPGSGVAVASKAYTTNGTLASTANSPTPGDCAVLLRQATTKVSSNNHPVYVHSYFHGARWTTASGNADIADGVQRDNISALGQAWLQGITLGARVYKRCTPDGHLVTSGISEVYVTHRDFPR